MGPRMTNTEPRRKATRRKTFASVRHNTLRTSVSAFLLVRQSAVRSPLRCQFTRVSRLAVNRYRGRYRSLDIQGPGDCAASSP